jgi:RNA recognition motif-containing protein
MNHDSNNIDALSSKGTASSTASHIGQSKNQLELILCSEVNNICNDDNDQQRKHIQRSQKTMPEIEKITAKNTVIYIGNIPVCYGTETIIEKLMSPYGTIVRCNVIRTPSTKTSSSNHNSTASTNRGPFNANTTNRTRNSNNKYHNDNKNNNNNYFCYAFCQFTTIEEASQAIATVNGRMFRGQRLNVRFATSITGNYGQSTNTSLSNSSLNGTSVNNNTNNHGNNTRQQSISQLDAKIRQLQETIASKGTRVEIGTNKSPEKFSTKIN